MYKTKIWLDYLEYRFKQSRLSCNGIPRFKSQIFSNGKQLERSLWMQESNWFVGSSATRNACSLPCRKNWGKMCEKSLDFEEKASLFKQVPARSTATAIKLPPSGTAIISELINTLRHIQYNVLDKVLQEMPVHTIQKKLGKPYRT